MPGGASEQGSRGQLAENPFFVLGVPPDSPRAIVEREGQKLLGMLEIGLEVAATYATPLGPRQRTAELVRWALAELRQPERRLLHELWAAAPCRPAASAAGGEAARADAPPDGGWPMARVIYGWEPRR